MPVNENISPSKIFDTANYLNAIHSTNIAVWEHFAGMLFDGDNSRVVYAPTDFAFRARQKVTKTSNLELPFMNFRIEALENNNERRWWNQYAQARGMYIPELKSRVRFSPVTINYDATLFTRNDIDSHFLIDQIFWDDSNETLFLNPYSQYSENDWLQKERIQAHALNMSVQTWFLRSNYDITLPKKLILGFAANHRDLADGIENPEMVYEAVVDHLNETVGPWTKV